MGVRIPSRVYGNHFDTGCSSSNGSRCSSLELGGILMSHVYAVVEGHEYMGASAERILVRIECDGCDATIKPHPEIAESGWMKTGVVIPGPRRNDVTRSDWCPTCYRNRRG